MAQTNPFFDVANNPFLNPENNPFMDPKNNPFAASNPFVGKDLKDMLSAFELPGLDIDGLLATQRRNIEAISSANKSAAEGIQTIFARQSEVLKTLMAEASSSVEEMSKANAPQEQITKQVELTKVKLEEAVANIREMSELAVKSQSEAFDILNARFNESIEEVQSLNNTTKAKAKAKTAAKK